jgi:predicted DNA-binding transcriptional regulator YafY
MGRRPVRERVDRGEQLLGLLRGRELWTAPELAEALGVSLRTVRRDLAALDARGVPLEAERGRGGGVRLVGTWGLGRVLLDEHELLDLVLALALAERLRSPLFLGRVRGVRHKLAAAFPPAQRRRLERVRRRVLVGEVASPAVRASYGEPRPSVVRALHQAFLEQRALVVDYASERGAPGRREVEPHYLLLNWPAWYLLVWDRGRQAGRSLRLDRVHGATPGTTEFTLRRAEELMADVGRFFAGV